MKCPECQKENKISSMWLQDEMYGTLNEEGELEVEISKKYWDEEGVFHTHDPNPHKRIYQCSNNHVWSVTTYAKCWDTCFWDPPHTITWDPTQEPARKFYDSN